MKDLVLVITFWERKLYLERILEYYNSFEKETLPYIIIVDQSEYTWKHKIESPSIDEWLHLPNLNFYEMQKFVINYTKKKYFFLLSDDDFAIPSALEMGVNFLDKNKEYISATGQIISLKRKRNFTGLYGFEAWTKKGLNDNDKKVRLSNAFYNFKEFTHVIYRSTSLLTALEIVLKSIDSKNSLAPIRYWGLILLLVSSLEGKIKNNLNCVSLVRTSRDLSGSGTHHKDFLDMGIKAEYPKVLERDLKIDSIKDRIDFQNPLSDFVMKHLNIDFKTSKRLIYQLFTNKKSYSVLDKFKLSFPSYKKSERNKIKKIKTLIY